MEAQRPVEMGTKQGFLWVTGCSVLGLGCVDVWVQWGTRGSGMTGIC